MAKFLKILGRLRSNPPPSDLKWSDVVTALQHLGYELKAGKGSRRKFYHAKKDHMIICHEPHPRPEVGKATVRDIAHQLEEQGFFDKESE